MKRTVRVLPGAEAELQSAALWYEEKRRGLGIELVAVVDQALQAVVESPEACPLWLKNRAYRKHSLKRFPHTVFFLIESSTIEIVAIAHAKRRPGYWLDRPR